MVRRVERIAPAEAARPRSRSAQRQIEGDDPVLDCDREGPDGRGGGQRQRTAGAKVEGRAVTGQMMPKVLWETTMNPRTRRLLKVEINDQIVTDRVINELMGKDPSARFRFIMERAEEAEELDV